MILFNKIKLLASLSLFTSSVILFYNSTKRTGESIIAETRHHNKDRHLTVVNSALSSIFKFLFENPLSGKNIKNLSCFAAFRLANVDFSQPDRFDDWLNEDTVLDLYSVGTIYGLDGIKEYVDFGYSDDFIAYESLSDQVLFSEMTEKSDVCNITYAAKRRIRMTDELFLEGTCHEVVTGGTARFTITGDHKFVLIEKINPFYPPGYFSDYYNKSKDGAFAERVCTVMEENCATVWEENAYDSQADCQASVNALPKSEGPYADGLCQGCRWVHSVFASKNEHHCEHISTIPLEDANGKLKCQSSANNQLTSIFSAGELLFYEETAVNEFDFDKSLFSVC